MADNITISASSMQSEEIIAKDLVEFDLQKPVFPYMQTVIAFELLVYGFETYLNFR